MNNIEEKQVPDNAASGNISKSKPRVRGRKRKRQDSESSSDIEDDLPENTLETEKNLQTLAIKNNLDDVSVKKILKKVVTNDHVLALVKMREEEEDSGIDGGLRPKLTRAKAKELRKVSHGNAWHRIELTPIKHIPVKTRPEVTALIAQDLPDDEDDEEYEPTHDDSDDDVTCSDLDSQPRTPATPASQKKENQQLAKDGPFKVPQEVSVTVRKKLDPEEEATIALRTRSKLSLSETPIEHIESSFIPPDDLPMPDVDDLWNEFLNECMNPESKANEDDDELDPEYNVAADPDANEEDEEALEKGIVKISKKELNDLVTELMSVIPEGVENQLTSNIQVDLIQGNNEAVATGVVSGPANKTDVAQTHWEGKQEPISDDESQTTGKAARITFESSNTITRVSIGKIEIEDVDEHEIDKDSAQDTSMADRAKIPKTEVPTTGSSDVPTTTGPRVVTISVEERELPVAEPAPPPLQPPMPLLRLVEPQPLTVNIEVDNTVKVSPEQVSILEQQLRQHIQLATSNFLQLFVHPIHWPYAPKYKEYLETFNKIASENPKSVVNVCNLTPAVELVRTWETTVSEDTEENKKMIEFVQAEIEKCRRRCAANNLYTGDFPVLFKKVVANSPVFLYPHMLPSMPYRANYMTKRFSYTQPEDELIVLGLDQFWWYVENNPEIFKPPRKVHPRHRWGLMITVGLICKHMFPWLTPKALLGHIQCVRKSEDKSNPIVKYFAERTIEPVRHMLLPFNPKLTLYEHPEIEIPRLWIKYLSINSKRFKVYGNRLCKVVRAPQGIEVLAGKSMEPIQKKALPIDFIKPISCNRANLLPTVPKPNYVDKFDVHITTTTSENVPNTNFLVASNIYTLVNTSTGAKLMPLNIVQTSTVNSSTTPICSTTVSSTNHAETNKCLEAYNDVEDNTKIAEISSKKRFIVITPDNALKTVQQLNHCPCCICVKRICKVKQTLVTDYWKPNIGKEKDCECTNKKYPRLTNKLKILVNNYKSLSNVLYTGLLQKLKENQDVRNKMRNESSEFNLKDFASAISYQTKLLMRTVVIRNNSIKNSVYNTFSKFDVESDDPLVLAQKLLKIFNVDLADMYKEFLGFLTAKQAATLGQFKDYFIGNCVEDLLKKVEEQVQDSVKRREIFEKIKELFTCKSVPPCEICCDLLMSVQEYPELARYIFSLFPHRRKEQ
ncbi:GON-4-like protein isoform X2 [Maniola jurtina]|nr:GON-4-like protein isoform X2 [Maniola jurtina]